MRKEESRLLAIGGTVKQYLHAKKDIDHDKLQIACKYAFGGVPLEYEPTKILKLYNDIQATAAQEPKSIMKEKVTTEYDGSKWKDPWDHRRGNDGGDDNNDDDNKGGSGSNKPSDEGPKEDDPENSGGEGGDSQGEKGKGKPGQDETAKEGGGLRINVDDATGPEESHLTRGRNLDGTYAFLQSDKIFKNVDKSIIGTMNQSELNMYGTDLYEDQLAFEAKQVKMLEEVNRRMRLEREKEAADFAKQDQARMERLEKKRLESEAEALKLAKELAAAVEAKKKAVGDEAHVEQPQEAGSGPEPMSSEASNIQKLMDQKARTEMSDATKAAYKKVSNNSTI